jgi:hypothetical protein
MPQIDTGDWYSSSIPLMASLAEKTIEELFDEIYDRYKEGHTL